MGPSLFEVLSDDVHIILFNFHQSGSYMMEFKLLFTLKLLLVNSSGTFEVALDVTHSV